MRVTADDDDTAILHICQDKAGFSRDPTRGCPLSYQGETTVAITLKSVSLYQILSFLSM